MKTFALVITMRGGSRVAQVGNLLCRGLAACGSFGIVGITRTGEGLPTASRRYSRLPVGATSGADA